MSESDYLLGPDGVAEEDAIIARLKANLVGGRVFEQITDEQIEAMGDVREVAPYIVIDFGQAAPTRGDRVLGVGELSQPYTMGISITCWSGRVDDVRRVAGAVRRLLIDWAPTETSAPLVGLAGMTGGNFTSTPARVQIPSRVMRQVTLMLTFNLGIPELA